MRSRPGDTSCGTVALMVLGQFSDIYRSANVRKLAKDHKGYGFAAKMIHA